MKYRAISVVALAHMITDINQGAVPALLPFLIATHGLSYTAAATVVFAANIASSLVQPLFGHFSDRISKAWLMPAGVLLSGLGLALTGVMPTYWLILCVVAASGIGIAAFHPEGARLVHQLSGKRKATGISFFAVGGQLGFATGPLVTTLAVVSLGMPGTLLLAIPVVVMSILLARQGATFSRPSVQAGSTTSSPSRVETGDDAWAPFIRLTTAIFFRSFAFYGLNTFLPLYWIHVLHQSKMAGGTALTIFLATGVVGTLMGGRMGDRYGYRDVAAIAYGVSSLLMPIFVFTENVSIATLLLVPLGIAHFFAFSPMIVMGQKFLPNRIGLASGVTLGLSVTVGGITAPFLGRIADTYGMHAAFMVIAVLPIAAGLLTMTLPRHYPAIKPIPNR